jgi:ubiquinone/menaquinone biosynthesis C-methylase UbiE
MTRKREMSSKRFRFYNELASLYDFICTPENRKRDVAVLEKIIKRHLKTKGKELLDVACGTGLEDSYLKKNFCVTGLDLNPGVLRIARERNPEITYVQGDMRDFRLSTRYDVITCFDAMCYLQNYKELRSALENFYCHLKSGGLLIFYIDPVFLKEHHIQDTIVVSRKSAKEKTVVLFEVYHKYRNNIAGYAAYLIIEANQTRFVRDSFEKLGFFNVKKVQTIIESMGLRTYLYNTGEAETFSLKKYDGTEQSPVFVCEKHQAG